MSEAGRHIAREAAISAGINGAISIAFFVLVFGGQSQIPVWGMGNYAFDFVPQSFAIGFMGTLVPALLCRKAMAGGRFASASAAALQAPGSIVSTALASGVAALVLGAGLWALALWAAGPATIGSSAAFALKVIYGAALGALVTTRTLQQILREEP